VFWRLPLTTGLGGPMFTYLSFVVARIRFALRRKQSTLALGPNRLRTIEVGQASVEYALVLLGAALVATLLITWATSTDLIGGLFDYILNLVKGKAK
jgi:Flp pilus assembly pilin Flp